MARLVDADDAHIESLYRQSYSLWGGGLSFEGYLGLWRDLQASRWGRRRLRYVVWLDDRGTLLSSLKEYRPTVRIGDRTGEAAVIGAVFTPAIRRRRGHASSLIRATLERARERGDLVAILFSDVGVDYYRRLGFRPLSATEFWGRLGRPAARVSDGWSLEPMSGHDLGAVREAHEGDCRRRRFTILRDRDHWEFLRTRAHGFFRRLEDHRVRHRCQVARRDGEFAGYVISVEGRGEWNIREVGAIDGDPDLTVEILAVAAAGAVRRAHRSVYGWLPRELTQRLPGWKVQHEIRRRAVPMIAPLAAEIDFDALSEHGAVEIPFMDQF